MWAHPSSTPSSGIRKRTCRNILVSMPIAFRPKCCKYIQMCIYIYLQHFRLWLELVAAFCIITCHMCTVLLVCHIQLNGALVSVLPYTHLPFWGSQPYLDTLSYPYDWVLKHCSEPLSPSCIVFLSLLFLGISCLE